MVALALATGIAPLDWVDMGERAIVTAWALLEKQHNRTAPGPPSGQAPGRPTKAHPQMSG